MTIEFMYQLRQKGTARNIQAGFLFLLFFSIPFSIAGNDGAIIGLYIVTGVLLAQKEIRWESLPIAKALYLFLLGAVISTLLSDAPLTGLLYFRNFWRLGLPFLIFFALKGQSVERYIRVMCVASIIIGLYAIVQFYTGLDILRSELLQNHYRRYWDIWPAVGAFSHHLTFGGVFLLLSAIFTALAFPKELSSKWRLFYTLAAIVCILSVVFSNGRSIWLGAITVGVVFLFVLTPRSVKIATLAILIALGVAFWLSAPHLKKTGIARFGLGHRVLSIPSLYDNKDRLMMWQAGVEIIKDHPVFGLGPKMFHKMQSYYQSVAETNNHTFQHEPSMGVHNIYLQNWVDFGFLGLLGFLWLFFSVIRAIALRINCKTVLRSTDHALLLGIMAGLCGNMVSGFFENNFRDGEVQTLVLTLMGIAMVLLKNSPTTIVPNH